MIWFYMIFIAGLQIFQINPIAKPSCFICSFWWGIIGILLLKIPQNGIETAEDSHWELAPLKKPALKLSSPQFACNQIFVTLLMHPPPIPVRIGRMPNYMSVYQHYHQSKQNYKIDYFFWSLSNYSSCRDTDIIHYLLFI